MRGGKDPLKNNFLALPSGSRNSIGRASFVASPSKNSMVGSINQPFNLSAQKQGLSMSKKRGHTVNIE